MPVKRSHTYRRLALQHGGADGKVSECVIVRAHDRSLPLRLKMFFSGNRTQKTLGSGEGNKEAAQDWETPKAVLDIQEAVANLADVLAELWPRGQFREDHQQSDGPVQLWGGHQGKRAGAL